MSIKLLINKKSLEFHNSQAFTEEAINNIYKSVGSSYIFLTYIKGSGNSIGLYCKGKESEERTYRRLTGGPSFNFYDNYEYLSIIINRVETLKKINEKAKNIIRCISGNEPYGGTSFSREKKIVYGITRLGNIGLIEIILNNNEKDIKDCLREYFGKIDEEEIDANPRKEISESYRKNSWINYGVKDYDYVSSESKDGFFVNLSAKLRENYLEKILITGNFYASPPLEPINAVLALEGTPINEVYFYGVKGRMGKIEVEGLSNENIKSAIDKLYLMLIKAI